MVCVLLFIPASNRTLASVGLKRSHKALCAPALRAFIDMMHKARLVRLGAGKAHLGAALHANWVDIEIPWVALWHARTPWLEYWPFLHAKSPQLLRQPTRVCSAQVGHATRQSSRSFSLPGQVWRSRFALLQCAISISNSAVFAMVYHKNRKTPISKPAANAQSPRVQAETTRARLRRSTSCKDSWDRSVIAAAPLRWPLASYGRMAIPAEAVTLLFIGAQKKARGITICTRPATLERSTRTLK
jgi:hypothetical protein